MKVFISYRRSDAAAEAGRLKKDIETHFGAEDTVFLDTRSIPPGSTWPTELRDKLNASKVVLVVIGPSWLSATDEYHRRRLDQEIDWVRNEIATALADKDLVVIPLRVGNAKLPPKGALPECLQALTDRQDLELRTELWDHDLKLLLAPLAPFYLSPGQEKPGLEGFLPEGGYEPPPPLERDRLRRALENEIPEWSFVQNPLSGVAGDPAEEIARHFTFNSFQEAVGFMAKTAPGCDIFNHHPRWEQIWQTVSIYLNTWDETRDGKRLLRVTDRDLQLAKYFDAAYLDHRNKR